MARRFSLVCVVALWSVWGVAGEAAGQETDPNSFQAVTLRLSDAKVSVKVDAARPAEVFDLIRKAGSVNIVLAPSASTAIADKTVTMELTDVSALSALHHLLRHLDLSANYADEALVVTSAEAVTPPPQISVYDIRDLLDGHRSFRLPPTLFGSQIDPLYWWDRQVGSVGPLARDASLRGFMDDLETLNYYPRDSFGMALAQKIEELTNAKERGVRVSYFDGCLFVVEQPKPARYSPGSGNIKDAVVPAASK